MVCCTEGCTEGVVEYEVGASFDVNVASIMLVGLVEARGINVAEDGTLRAVSEAAKRPGATMDQLVSALDKAAQNGEQ